MVNDEWMNDLLKVGKFLVGSTVALGERGGCHGALVLSWVVSSWSEITVVFLYVCFV